MALLELDTYTGQLNYKDILFTFVFDGSELCLIPPADKSSEIEFNWILTPTGEGTYTSVLLLLETSIPTAVISIDFILLASFLCLFRLMPITDSACFVTRMYSDKSQDQRWSAAFCAERPCQAGKQGQDGDHPERLSPVQRRCRQRPQQHPAVYSGKRLAGLYCHSPST